MPFIAIETAILAGEEEADVSSESESLRSEAMLSFINVITIINKYGILLFFQFFLDFIYEIYKKIRMESQFFLDFIYEIYKKIRMESQFFLDFIYEI